MTEPSRREELQAALESVRARIDAHAAQLGHAGGPVTLVVVTKTWPVSDLRILHDLGVRDFGENRLQEAERKAAELVDLELRWHFIGQIQSKKAAKVAGMADLVHSVDSLRLAERLSAGAQRLAAGALDCLVQVSLDDIADADVAGRRGGVRPDDVAELATAVEAASGLRLRGVMGVAPPDVDPRPSYDLLVDCAARVRLITAEATVVSAGMSGDYTVAVDAGATLVRVGSAILGRRTPLG